MKDYDIFISYRSKGGLFVANHLFDVLERDGYKVSFDIDNLKEGKVKQLFHRIEKCTDFLVIIDEHAFDDIRNSPDDYDIEKDWMRQEIAYALKLKNPEKNIIPIYLSDALLPNKMPEDIKELGGRSRLKYKPEEFKSFYKKLIRFLHSQPGVKKLTNPRDHFPNSLEIVQDKMIPTMNKKARQTNRIDENNKIDSYIQSPIEYANEIVYGNQVPEFKPDALYHDVLFDKKIKYIVAITAENPNMFMDPTIGFYMSNCYAISIMRHMNDYIQKNYKSNPNKIPEICVKNFNDLDDDVKMMEKKIIQKLKRGTKLKDYEFIRIFMYDKIQEKSFDKTIFPSLKASQDLFRTPSFYIKRDNLEDDLKHGELEDDKHQKYTIEQFHNYNKELWGYFKVYCKKNHNARKILSERIDKTIPEFLFVFYDRKIVIHTYLGGEHFDVEAEMKSDKEKNIKELIKILAAYIDKDVDKKDDKRQLYIDPKLRNRTNTFIDCIYVNPKK